MSSNNITSHFGSPIADQIDSWAKENYKILYYCLTLIMVLWVVASYLGYAVVKQEKEIKAAKDAIERLSNPTMTMRFQQNEWGLGGAEHAAGGKAVFVKPGMTSNFVLAAPEFDCANRVPQSDNAWDWANTEVHSANQVEGACVPGGKTPCNDNKLSAILAGGR